MPAMACFSISPMKGRGIGLMNKLRAYQLQDRGLDTVDANEHLGFEPDERSFQAAASMLRHLGIKEIRLMTNNPSKVEALALEGVNVVERVRHAMPANPAQPSLSRDQSGAQWPSARSRNHKETIA